MHVEVGDQLFLGDDTKLLVTSHVQENGLFNATRICTITGESQGENGWHLPTMEITRHLPTTGDWWQMKDILGNRWWAQSAKRPSTLLMGTHVVDGPHERPERE